MESLNFGIFEVVISCLVGLLALGLPISIMVFLIMIYKKLKSIEGALKKE